MCELLTICTVFCISPMLMIFLCVGGTVVEAKGDEMTRYWGATSPYVHV